MFRVGVFTLLVFCSLLHLGFTQNPCAIGNGGCSDQCLYRGSGDVQCGCPCGRDMTSSTTCGFPVVCGLDIYVLVDVSLTIDLVDCTRETLGLPGTNTYPGWQEWRDQVVTILEGLQTVVSDPDVNIGVQTFADRQTLTTIANYTTTPDLSDAIETLDGETTPNCIGTSAFMEHLSNVGDTNPVFPDFETLGPYQLRNFDVTSRLAIAINHSPVTSIDEESVIRWKEIIDANFDDVIVITRTQTELAENDVINTWQSRFIACGDGDAPCRKVFWFDRTNDFDLPLNLVNIWDAISRDACNTRQETNAEPITIDSCDNIMVFTVELCTLRGMNASDLQFLDPDCLVEEYSVIDGDSMIITMPFFACGMIQEFDVVDGAATNVFTQILSTRQISDSQNLIDVELNATCCVPVLPDDVYTFVEPARDTVAGNISAEGVYPLSVDIFLTDAFTIPQLGEISIVVGCDVYVEAVTVIPTDFTLRLWSCWATPSPSPTDPTSYYLAEDGCPSDPTFELLESPSSDIVRFLFEMFQFTEGFLKSGESAPPVYIHCRFTVCEDTDTSDRCSPCVQSRKRRQMEEQDGETSITKTIGPFKVVPKESDETEQQGAVSQEVEPEVDLPKPINDGYENTWKNSPRTIQLVVPESSFRPISYYSHLFLMAIVVLAIAYFLWSFNRRPRPAYDIPTTPAVIPGQFCAKQPVGFPVYYANPDGETTSPVCEHCKEQPVITGQNQSDGESPPEYEI